MKKVRYLAGLAGLVPVAATVMAPATAQAGVTAQQGHLRSPAKMVSLHPAAVHPGATCGHTTESVVNNNYASVRFWHNGGCIGTVNLYIYGSRISKYECSYHPQIHIYWKVLGVQHSESWSFPTGCGMFSGTLGVYQSFGTSVGVYGKGVVSGVGNVYGPAGKTIT